MQKDDSMKVPYFIPWINNDDKKSILKSLENRWLTGGPLLKKFENKTGKFIGTEYAIGVSNATSALHLSLLSLGIGSGDEVILPTLTFAATENAVLYCKAKPVLADIDPNTFNILPHEITKKITKRTKAILVVHYGGQSCDMNKILKIAKKYKLHIVEDCAHAFGSTYEGKKCGSIGKTGCFSFYPTKIITTGEGGMITTNQENLKKKITILRSQGVSVDPLDREKKKSWHYDVIDLGFNYRLDEIRSSLGLSQIKRVNKINELRIKIAQKYNKRIKKIKGLTIPLTSPNRNHIYHLYTLKIENDYHLSRDELIQKFQKKGIGYSIQYTPLHLMSYNKNRFNKNLFPNADKIKDKIISLPIFPRMINKQIDYVLSALK